MELFRSNVNADALVRFSIGDSDDAHLRGNATLFPPLLARQIDRDAHRLLQWLSPAAIFTSHHPLVKPSGNLQFACQPSPPTLRTPAGLDRESADFDQNVLFIQPRHDPS